MKKILLFSLLTTTIFASSLEDRVKVLEEKVNTLETQIKQLTSLKKDVKKVKESQTNITKEIQKGIILRCDKLKLLTYNYRYDDAGLIKSYTFNYKLKNDYNKSIRYIYASIKFTDNEDSTLVEDYIKKTILIKPSQEVNIKTNYLVDEGSLSEYLKDTPKKELKVEFKPFTIEFSDGQKLRCN